MIRDDEMRVASVSKERSPWSVSVKIIKIKKLEHVNGVDTQ